MTTPITGIKNPDSDVVMISHSWEKSKTEDGGGSRSWYKVVVLNKNFGAWNNMLWS